MKKLKSPFCSPFCKGGMIRTKKVNLWLQVFRNSRLSTEVPLFGKEGLGEIFSEFVIDFMIFSHLQGQGEGALLIASQPAR